MSGTGYPKKLRNEKKMIGCQHIISVATIKDILKNMLFSFLGLFLESFLELANFVFIKIKTYPIKIKETRSKLKLIIVALNIEITEELE